MQIFSILIPPGLFRVVSVVEKNGGRIPVELFLWKKRSSFQDQQLLPGAGQLKGESPAPSARADDNYFVMLVRHRVSSCLTVATFRRR